MVINQRPAKAVTTTGLLMKAYSEPGQTDVIHLIYDRDYRHSSGVNFIGDLSQHGNASYVFDDGDRTTQSYTFVRSADQVFSLASGFSAVKVTLSTSNAGGDQVFLQYFMIRKFFWC